MFCEICGSEKVIQKVTSKEYCVPYGKSVPVSKTINECAECGSRIDSTNDDKIENAITLSTKESVKNILGYLKSAGYSLSHIERGLELPQRTLSRWKSSLDTSAIGIALLRIIRTYPWIIDVAENHFESDCANFLLIQNGNKCLSFYIEENTGLLPSIMRYTLQSDRKSGRCEYKWKEEV